MAKNRIKYNKTCHQAIQMPKKRDNFPPSVVSALRDRVGGVCSNPNCRRVTLGPKKSNNKKPTILGEAAHICAASQGGPRYDPNMTSEQRRSIENGIWLCEECSSRIDKDQSKFSVALLQAWKIDAEKSASIRLGNPIPGHNEVLNGIAPWVGQPYYFYEGIASASHAAYEQYLKALDPRFHVQVDRINGARHITLSHVDGMPPATLTLTIAKPEDNKQLEEVRLFGGKAEISGAQISFTDLPLLDNFVRDTEIKNFSVSAHSEDITCRIDVLNSTDNSCILNIQTTGHLSSGTAGIKIALEAWNGLWSMVGNLDLRESKKGELAAYKPIHWQTKFKFDKWDGDDINELDNFADLHTLCKIYSKSNPIRFNLRSKTLGKQSLDATIKIHDGEKIATSLEYIKMIKTICHYTGQKMSFYHHVEFTTEDYRKIANIIHVIENGPIKITEHSDKHVCHATINVDKNNFDLFKKLKFKKEKTFFTIQETSPEIIKIFGESVKLPLQKRVFNNVIPVVAEELAPIEIGNSITLEFFPTEDFSCEVSFVDVAAHQPEPPQ